VLLELRLAPAGYLLATLHRAENVDVPDRLAALVAGLDRVQREHGRPVIVSTHPRTRQRLNEATALPSNANVRYLAPFGFPDFLALERSAACVLTDSGTVQEECAILGVPSVTLRDVTERPEVIEHGGGLLCGADPERIADGVRAVLALPTDWAPPPEYMVRDVSSVVVRIALGSLPSVASR
jgi:UDP-N-acetylglucosamine 2-epimerase (non-hydrolysing)